MTMTLTRLTFTIPANLWMSANRPIPNHGYKQRIVRDLQTIAATVARQTRTPAIDVPVRAHWLIRYPKGVRLDKGEATNALPTTKAILDGIVLARLIPDDGPQWIRSDTFERGPNLDRPRDHEITLSFTTYPLGSTERSAPSSFEGTP